MKQKTLPLPDRAAALLPKAPSGIRGLDGIAGGGLPAGRPTLVCGSAGCGKTLMGMEFLVHGAVDDGERNRGNRGLTLLKSRGMAHSNPIRESKPTDHGVVLVDVSVGPGGVLTGSARLAQESRERAERRLAQQHVAAIGRSRQFDGPHASRV